MMSIPKGYCQCGCGEKTPIATRTSRTDGRVKGEPVRYVRGHNKRRHDFAQRKHWLEQEYLVRERTVADIARECGVRDSTLYHWFRKYGISRRNRSDAQTSQLKKRPPQGCLEDIIVDTENNAAYVPLSGGHRAIIDIADVALVGRYRWHPVEPHEGAVYAYWPGGKSRTAGPVYMHTLIMGESEGEVVFHKNGDGLDNRRENLAFRNWSQVQMGKRSYRESTSPYKGVSWVSSMQKWKAQIKAKGRPAHIGYFTDEEEAARAYDAEARVWFGPYARLNFPEDDTRLSLDISDFVANARGEDRGGDDARCG